jgi:hypothetical protein
MFISSQTKSIHKKSKKEVNKKKYIEIPSNPNEKSKFKTVILKFLKLVKNWKLELFVLNKTKRKLE